MVNFESRTFYLKIHKFENGYFVSITEGNDKLGSMIVSLATGPTPTTTTIIPSRNESLSLRLIAERIRQYQNAVIKPELNKFQKTGKQE